MLRKLDENLWVAEQPLSFMGLAVGARMTVIRLGTLVLTDMAHNIGPDAGASARFFFRLFGGYGRLSVSIVERMVNRDRLAVRRTVDTILQWDFQSVILAHGRVVEGDGAQAFREAYAWL